MYPSTPGGVRLLGFFNLSTPPPAKTDSYGTKTRKLHFWHLKAPKSKTHAHPPSSNPQKQNPNVVLVFCLEPRKRRSLTWHAFQKRVKNSQILKITLRTIET